MKHSCLAASVYTVNYNEGSVFIMSVTCGSSAGVALVVVGYS